MTVTVLEDERRRGHKCKRAVKCEPFVVAAFRVVIAGVPATPLKSIELRRLTARLHRALRRLFRPSLQLQPPFNVTLLLLRPTHY